MTRALRSDGATPSPFPLPLVGRLGDQAALRLLLDDAMDGRGRVAFVTGESGIGKSRLVEHLVKDARSAGALVLEGQGFVLESDRPWGIWADALTPWVRTVGASTLAIVGRGLERDLAAIVPALASSAAPPSSGDKGSLFWNFSQFIARLAARQPLMLVLEDLHYADAASLELAHFLARQVTNTPVLVVGTWVTGAERTPAAEQMARSLPGTSVLTRALAPLTRHDLRDLMQRAFRAVGEDVSAFCDSLFERTAGNPFFVEEILKSMVAADTLRTSDAGWEGFGRGVNTTLPTSVREAVTRRLEPLSPAVRHVAEVVALAGTHASLALLEPATQLSAGTLATALDELESRGILRAPANEDAPYLFVHHLVLATLEETISVARARATHRAIAQVLARDGVRYGADLARHLTRAGLAVTPEALPHLVAAGRQALARHADADAERWLSAALDLLPADGSQSALGVTETVALHADLARAQQRNGRAEAAHANRVRALDLATTIGNQAVRSGILRDIANASAFAGRGEEALSAFREAVTAARQAGDEALASQSIIATAMTLQSLGRIGEATGLLEASLPDVEALGNPKATANIHRALVMLYGWTGPAEKARTHAARALAEARLASDDDVAWSVHWALAVLEGFSGNGDGVKRHREEAARLADAIDSPIRQAITAEVAIEYLSAVGEWDEAQAWADRAIPIARAVASRTLLPRLLVWTGLVLLARDERQRAREMLDEAWELSGAGLPGTVPAMSVQNVILAHTGRAALHIANGEFDAARGLGEKGLSLADRYGLVAWGIHRLLPQIAEAAMWQQDYERAVEVAQRLRRDGASLGHKLAIAWASAIDTLVARLRDGKVSVAPQMLHAADELDAIPFVFHAARLRRNAAQILEADGQIDAAIRELRRAHEVFSRCGAELELRGTRSQLRSLGVRLPPRVAREGAGALTGRELDIARCVSQRLSNKQIGQRLDISSRTVSTHLSSIFQKLGVDSRGALVDAVRRDPRLAPPGE